MVLMSCAGEEVTPDTSGGTNPGSTLTVEKAMQLLTQPNPSNGQGVWQDQFGWEAPGAGTFYNNLEVDVNGVATWSQEIPAGRPVTNDPTPQCGTISFRADPERPGQLEMVITPTGTFSSPETCESQKNSTYMYFGSIPAEECGQNMAFLDMRNDSFSPTGVSSQPVYLDVIKLTEKELRVSYANVSNTWLRWRKNTVTGEGSLAPNQEYVWTR